MKIHLFTQCMVDMFYPQVGIAAVEVLERLGCDITVPKKQVCCGQPLINSGYVRLPRRRSKTRSKRLKMQRPSSASPAPALSQ